LAHEGTTKGRSELTVRRSPGKRFRGWLATPRRYGRPNRRGDHCEGRAPPRSGRELFCRFCSRNFFHCSGDIGLKAALDGSLGREAARERDRQRALEELTLREFGTDDDA
jgi:hypothetical protein